MATQGTTGTSIRAPAHDEDGGERPSTASQRAAGSYPDGHSGADGEIEASNVGHSGSLAARGPDHKFDRKRGRSSPNCCEQLALAASMAQGNGPHDRSRHSTDPTGAADPKGSAAIEVAHLVKLYKTSPKDHRAVDDVSFRIARAGSITGLLGGNGAGKTTTIAMLMGLVLPTSGCPGAGLSDARAERRGAGPDEFESPMSTCPCGSRCSRTHHLRPPLCLGKSARGGSRNSPPDLDLGDFPDRANGKLSAGKDARGAWRKR